MGDAARSTGPRERIPTLVEPVDSAPTPSVRDRPVLMVLSGPSTGAILPVHGELLVGRGDHCDLELAEPTVSWSHARFSERLGHIELEDLGSTNGTFVRGERVHGRRLLSDGDRIRIGPRVVFKLMLQDALEERASRQLWESSVRDPLTGLHNRRYLDERIKAEFSYAQRHGDPLSVLMVDIDHFKRVNDRAGHAVGDAVLRIVAASIQRVIRPEDVLARYGGEEFVVIARRVDQRNATILAERIRSRVERLPLPLEVDVDKLTVSVGVATMTAADPYELPEQLVRAADSAMYAAKGHGRNRVVCA